MKIYCTLLLLLFGLVLSGQAMRIEYFTVTDGLSTRDINALHIGDDGYLWVATMDGLNRFDGHSFVAFAQESEQGAGLSRGAIEDIRSDNDGQLIITFDDFYGYFDRFDAGNFSVEHVKILPSTGVDGYPRAIETDDLGRTFVVTIGEKGTTLYEYTAEGFSVIYREDATWTTFAPRINLLPLSNGQFLLYDEQHGFRHISANGTYLGNVSARLSLNRRLYEMIEGPDGFVYLSFRDGYPLYRWPINGRQQAQPVPNLDDGLQYPKIFRDELGQLLLLGTEDILGNQYPDEYYLIDTAGRFQLFERELPTNRLVSSVAAVNFNETIYLGLREGLGVIERYVKPIDNYLTDSDGYREDSSVEGIAEDTAGTVYLATREGTFYSMARGSKVMLPMWLHDSDSVEVSVRQPRQLIFDRIRNAVWAAAQSPSYRSRGVLLRYNVATGTTETYPAPFPLCCLAIGPEGNIYVGSNEMRKDGALLHFDAQTGKYSPLLTGETGDERLRNLRIQYLYFSRSGKLLLGTTSRGLFTYDPMTGQTKSYGRTDPGEQPVEANALVINSIYEDVGGKWWLGTDAGLRIIDPVNNTERAYGRQDGLSNNKVMGVVPDSIGGYWLSTHNGLVQLPQDLDNGTFRRYYPEDGLATGEFNRYAFHRDRSGRYFFGGDHGLSVFRDSDLSMESAGSDVMLTEVVVYGRGVSRAITKDLDQLTEIEVMASEKSIAASFALPVGQRPSLTQLRVKLDGFNEEWRELRNERTVRYNNLPSGHYQLLVQAAGANGNYGDQLFTLNIHVRQYLIEKTWFQFLIATVIVGLFFFILQAKLRERLRNEQLRTQLSSDIHDEVSGLLAGITLQAELLQHRTEDEKLRIRLQTVGEAGRNAMSKMSDVIWSIDSRRDNIGNLLQRMQEHADEVLLPLDIRYDFTAKGFNIERELAGNLRQDLYFIYKEAINNIARHSNATSVEIELEQYAQTFEMFIRDNGKGKETDEYPVYSSTRFTPKKGQGKDNMRMRAQRLRAELSIDDRSGYTLTLRMRRLA